MRLFARLFRSYKATVEAYERYAGYNPSPLSLKQLLDFGAQTGSENASFEFLRKEMPVRMANIMKEISILPDSLLEMPSLRLIMNWYEQSFVDLIQFENVSKVDGIILKEFTKMIMNIKQRHSNIVETMAQGVLELKERHGIDSFMDDRIQYFLDRFFMSRIGIRMLLTQHMMLFGENSDHSSQAGCIDPNCNIQTVVEDAYENANFLCEQYYLTSPKLSLQFLNKENKDYGGVTMVYVPSHLYHMVFELLKNAMRATVEHYPDGADLPPIVVSICRGEEDICIKMSDQGGGIPRSKMEMLFRYLYSTAPMPCRSDTLSAPLAGYGYGLPLSRLYARYFHGDLVISSVEGYGSDALIYLKVPCEEANELLPVYNYTASKVYGADRTADDWSSAPKSSKSQPLVMSQLGWSSDHVFPHRPMSTVASPGRLLSTVSNHGRPMSTMANPRRLLSTVANPGRPMFTVANPGIFLRTFCSLGLHNQRYSQAGLCSSALGFGGVS